MHFHEGPDYECTTDRIEKRRKKLRTRRDMNPHPLCHEACALLHCYYRCPLDLFLSIPDFDELVGGNYDAIDFHSDIQHERVSLTEKESPSTCRIRIHVIKNEGLGSYSTRITT